MANPILLKSTLIFGTIQLISMIALESRNIAFNTNIAFGIVTSIINHGTTSNIAKWSDRTMMLVGIFTDIHVIESMHLPPYYIYYPYICYYFLSLSILSFAMSKWINSILNLPTHHPFQNSLLYLISSCHITSHLLLTITHILMMYRLTYTV